MTVLRREPNNSKREDHNVKLTLFEVSSGRQDVFVYTESDILSTEQQEELKKPRANVNNIFKAAIDLRLRIK